MNIDNLNNLSQISQGSSQESTTDNNFYSCDVEVVSRTRDQNRIVQGLKAKIIVLERKLVDAELSCENQKERNDLFARIIKDKEDIIRTLNVSIELTNKFNDSKMNQMQSEIDELKKALDISNNQNTTKSPEDKFEKQMKKIHPIPGLNDFQAVFQDIPSAGSGWMVIQRRIDGSVSFSEMQLEHDFCYKTGFGNIAGEFWLGCEKLHLLTTSRRHELYIQLVDFDDCITFARYDNFSVGSEIEGYSVKSLGLYSGNAGDAMSGSLNRKFKHYECYYSGLGKLLHWSWWIGSQCNLNGYYHSSKIVLTDTNGVWWGNWNNRGRSSLKSCKMLIRPMLN
nr:microfibril-associated glycoprotein 4-like [Drosophila suzukii]XP_036671751.1 microfibril-associated glycoprotein 4-like [Drosophila suzukii]